LAIETLSAGNCEWHDHSVTLFVGFDCGSDLNNRAGSFVALYFFRMENVTGDLIFTMMKSVLLGWWPRKT
jgi:hypothetical protein